MKIITVVNNKGGCGKSTIALNLSAGLALAGYRTLLMDLDPAAQVTEWLGLKDGLTSDNTLVMVMAGQLRLPDVVRPTRIKNLSLAPTSDELEVLGRHITAQADYHLLLTQALGDVVEQFDFVVIDSPNEISPIMENAIHPADLLIVPFDGTKAVKRFGNLHKLLLNLKRSDMMKLYVLINVDFAGLRNEMIKLLKVDGIVPSSVEIRHDGWLARVDLYGGSIFDYRPSSGGAQDLLRLRDEVLVALGYPNPHNTTPIIPAPPASVTQPTA